MCSVSHGCPCGYFTHPTKAYRCTPARIEQYRSKISGPLLNRIDIHIEVPRVNYKELSDSPNGEISAEIQKRVNKARKIQHKRFKKSTIFVNAYMSHTQIKNTAGLMKNLEYAENGN